MSIDNPEDTNLNLYNQPTQPQGYMGGQPPDLDDTAVYGQAQAPQPTNGLGTTNSVPPQGMMNQSPRGKGRRMSRRALVATSVAGLAAVGIGGVALAEWMNGGFNNLFHGPMGTNTQVGHLLRRAGFGATSDELATYKNLGFNGAVDRLLN